MLWQYLSECGYQDYHLEYIWQQIEDAVIKTILVALPEMRKEFHEMETISAYNTYKILGPNHLLLWRQISVVTWTEVLYLVAGLLMEHFLDAIDLLRH